MDVKYISLFPFEVLERICFYLSTVDVIKLSEILGEFDNVSCSTRVIKNVNLFHEYYLTKQHITVFFAQKPRCNFIVSLNLNCVYWIPAADIRKCVSLLENLQCLYLVDTKLGLLKPDVMTYSKIPQLKKLGLSVTKRTFCRESLKYFPKVTHFYLHLDLTHFYLHLDSETDAIVKHVMSVLRKHNSVTEFWLIESATLSFIPLSLLPRIAIPSSVVKFNSLLHNIHFCNEEVTQMQRVHRSTFTRMAMCWEKSGKPTKNFNEIDFNRDWDTFFDLSRTHDPFTPKQTKEILTRESIEDMYFDEINFAHDPNICGETYKSVIEKLMLYDSMKFLKKLALGFCACISEDFTEETPTDTKRKKRINGCLLNEICENSPNIEELELWSCLRVNGCRKITNNSCSSIAGFKYLRKLTLDNLPIHISGSFLINVFSSCKQLSSLRIKSKQQNTNLHNFLCLSLAQAESLKDLRYEHPCNISIDRLLNALSQNRKLSIERLFVKCKSVEIFSAKPIQTFLESSANLRFLYLAITDLPKVVIKHTMKSLEKYNEDPRKILLITHSEYSYNGRIQIPFIHTYEMIMSLTHVSGLDIFNGYI